MINPNRPRRWQQHDALLINKLPWWNRAATHHVFLNRVELRRRLLAWICSDQKNQFKSKTVTLARAPQVTRHLKQKGHLKWKDFHPHESPTFTEGQDVGADLFEPLANVVRVQHIQQRQQRFTGWYVRGIKDVDLPQTLPTTATTLCLSPQSFYKCNYTMAWYQTIVQIVQCRVETQDDSISTLVWQWG